MGRQTSRIWLANGTDHKEMITWNGSGFQYHDKAYIWNGSKFQKVWEKIKSLTCLYDLSYYCFKPVSSKNNRYVYFAKTPSYKFEDTADGSTIYRITIDNPEDDPPVIFQDDSLTTFSAPTSSQGIGMQYVENSNTNFTYKMLDLENGVYGHGETFDAAEHGISAYGIYDYSIDEDSQAVYSADSGNNYLLRQGFYLLNNYYYLLWTQSLESGISFIRMDNTIGSLSDYSFHHIGGYNFISYSQSSGTVTLRLWTISSLYYVNVATETAPFTVNSSRFHVVGLRGNKFAIEADNYEIWIIEVGDSGFTYTNTGIKSANSYYGFDITPDFKYLLTFTVESKTGTANQIHPLIVNIDTEQTEIDLWDELPDFSIRMDYNGVFQPFFVGERCLCVGGYVNNYTHIDNKRQRLYKWR